MAIKVKQGEIEGKDYVMIKVIGTDTEAPARVGGGVALPRWNEMGDISEIISCEEVIVDSYNSYGSLIPLRKDVTDLQLLTKLR